MALEMVDHAGFEECFKAGVVITGGASQAEGIMELAEEIFECEVRLGIPDEIPGPTSCPANPAYATAQGLLLYGLTQAENGGPRRVPGFLGRVFDKFIKTIDMYV